MLSIWARDFNEFTSAENSIPLLPIDNQEAKHMTGKVAVITGGNGTLGRAFAMGLGLAGAKVFILGRNEIKSKERIAELQNLGCDAHAITCDVLDEQSVQKACNAVLEQAKKIDILVNGAGGNRPGATIMPDQSIFNASLQSFRDVFDLNLMGTVIPSFIFAKAMVGHGSGCIINISSMAAQLPLTRVVAYSASKAAVDNFTKWLTVELASKYGSNIRINAIAPGFFIADQNRSLLQNADGSLTDRGKTIINQTPAKRFGEPDELISTLLWLCDDRSSFVNGAVIPVDGGFSAFSGV